MENTNAPVVRKADWKHAWTALRGLIADPERTDLVFEIIDSLAGPAFEREFQRFIRSADGVRLLKDRPSLLATLANRAALEQMPEGSLGRAYAKFMSEGNLTAEGLVEAEEKAQTHDDWVDEERVFFGDRLRDMHDLWHVLTGYGRDHAGEVANLAFSAGQIPSRGIYLIVLAAAWLGPKSLDFWWQRYLLRAWRRGRKAQRLAFAYYEELLPLPLDEVRRKLGVGLPRETHPEGIVVANRDEQFAFVAG